jgi:hypothetical protein
MSMRVVGVLLVACVWSAVSERASAEESFAAAMKLRGGYDSNPEFSVHGIGGSAFISSETALIAGQTGDKYTLGFVGEASSTHYSNPQATPALAGKAILRGSIGDDDASLTSTTTLSDVRTYNLRASDVVQSLKGEIRIGAIKLFATGEGGRASLNQTNVIFQDFLPSPQQYWRATIIPGVSVVAGKWEVGTSVNYSVRRYLEKFDDFGYRRDNERLQPFLFAKYTSDELTAFAAMSRLYGTWHDPDFTNVQRNTFEANISWRPAPYTLEVSAVRRAGETTFPISPITIDSLYSVRGSWQASEKIKLLASAGYTTSEYLDSIYRSETATVATGVQYDLGSDLTLGADLTYATGRLISGDHANAFIVGMSLSKRFSPFEKEAVKETGISKTPIKVAKR